MHTHPWGELQKYKQLLQDQLEDEARMQAEMSHGGGEVKGSHTGASAFQADGSGNSAWQRTLAANRKLNSKGR